MLQRSIVASVATLVGCAIAILIFDPSGPLQVALLGGGFAGWAAYGVMMGALRLARQWTRLETLFWKLVQARNGILPIAIVFLLLVALSYLMLFILPEQAVVTAKLENDKERLELINEYRRTWASVLGGGIVLLGITIGWWRAAAAHRQATATEEGQITERFTRAIDQLGQAHGEFDQAKIVRLGGIYALEQIAKDAPKKFHWQIMEVLTAYIREHAQINEERDEPRVDVQAALSVIACRDTTHDPPGQRIDLAHTNLEGANLAKADLGRASLDGAILRKACLERANLEEASLKKANLGNAILHDAKLQYADLEGAELQDAELPYCDLNGAELSDANLSRATLFSAKLDGSQIDGANIEGTDLNRVTGLDRQKLCSADFDKETIFPDGTKDHTHEEYCKDHRLRGRVSISRRIRT